MANNKTPKEDEKIVRYKSGDVIFREGDYGADAYIVLVGEVVLSKTNNGEKLLFDKVGKHGVFGEMALFDQKRRLVEAVAVLDTECIIIDEIFLTKQLAVCHPLISGLFRVMAKGIKRQMDMRP